MLAGLLAGLLAVLACAHDSVKHFCSLLYPFTSPSFRSPAGRGRRSSRMSALTLLLLGANTAGFDPPATPFIYPCGGVDGWLLAHSVPAYLF